MRLQDWRDLCERFADEGYQPRALHLTPESKAVFSAELQVAMFGNPAAAAGATVTMIHDSFSGNDVEVKLAPAEGYDFVYLEAKI